MSALKLSRELNIQYKTAFVLLHKFREALLETRDENPLDGVCCECGNTQLSIIEDLEDSSMDRSIEWGNYI